VQKADARRGSELAAWLVLVQLPLWMTVIGTLTSLALLCWAFERTHGLQCRNWSRKPRRGWRREVRLGGQIGTTGKMSVAFKGLSFCRLNGPACYSCCVSCGTGIRGWKSWRER